MWWVKLIAFIGNKIFIVLSKHGENMHSRSNITNGENMHSRSNIKNGENMHSRSNVTNHLISSLKIFLFYLRFELTALHVTLLRCAIFTTAFVCIEHKIYRSQNLASNIQFSIFMINILRARIQNISAIVSIFVLFLVRSQTNKRTKLYFSQKLYKKMIQGMNMQYTSVRT